MPSSSFQSEVDLSAVLNMYVYMDQQDPSYDGLTVSQALEHIPDGEYKRMVVKAIEADKSIGNIKIIGQSSTTPGVNTDLCTACTFQDDSGNVYVVYRGTGDGKWPDNGEGMYKESTAAQEANLEYFNAEMERLNGGGDIEGKLIVTGHSKGGNSAQYVTLASEYSDRIDACYSLDGQGFSDVAIDKFDNDPNYQEKLDKMYSICGKNDYVHELGIKVISDDHTYYLDNGDAEIGNCHHIGGMMSEDGDGLKWEYTETGEISHGEAGEIALYARDLSERVMALPPEERQDVCLSLMSILEAVFPYPDENGNNIRGGIYKQGLGDEKFADFEEFIGFLYHGLPIILDELLTTEEGRALLSELLKFGFEKVMEEMGPWGTAALGLIIIATAPVWGTIAQLLLERAASFVILHETIYEIIENAKEISEKVKQDVLSFYNDVVAAFDKIASYIKDRSPGGQYASSNPQICLNTTTLKNYSSRLSAVNKRIVNLDFRMDGLYTKVKLTDLYDLIKADALTGWSAKLRLCIAYLDNTAQDFEKVETTLLNA